MRCFVTVGSTQFERLISALFHDDLLRALCEIGIKNVVIQNGSGKIPDCFQKEAADGEGIWMAEIEQIKFSLFRYKNSIREEMEGADLVVGHAGAGTCMEVLELGKPFVAVINNGLMNDHQLELAEQLAKDGHLLCTLPENMSAALRDPSLFSLTPLPKTDPSIFLQFINTLLTTNSS